MSEKSDIEALRALTSEPKNQTKIGRLRGLYDEIENLKKAGVKNKTILKTLNDIGFDINLNQLETMLYTIRKERKKNPDKNTAAASQTATPKENYQDNSEITKIQGDNKQSEKQAEEQELEVDEFEGLDRKQRREKLGDKFFKSNTILNKVKKD